MQIRRAEALVVSIPRRRAHQMSGLDFRAARHLLIQLVGDAGVEGWGEASVFPTWSGDYGRYYGESARADQALFEELIAPAMIGREFDTAAQLHAAMDAVLAGYPYLKSAMDVAWHDLRCKELGVPLYAYLGGKQRDGVPVCYSIGFMAPDEAASGARAAIEEGAASVKVKIGRSVDEDRRVVQAVRAAVGPRMPIGVDGNRGFKACLEALRCLAELGPAGLAYAEQPVEGIASMARLRTELARVLATGRPRNSDLECGFQPAPRPQRAEARPSETSRPEADSAGEPPGIPLLLDESVWNEQDLVEAAAARAGDGISIYIGKVGGVARAMALGLAAARIGYACNVNGSGELGIANAANVHLALALPRLDFHAVIPISAPQGQEPTRVLGRQYADDLLVHSLVWSGRDIRPGEGPGLGIEVDRAKIETYRIA